MDPTFWTARWREGAIGFHEGAPNAYLVKHAARLPGPRVLVPLCGKAEDLAYLAAQGHQVVGVELVEDAVRAFFTEHAATPAVAPRGAVTAYTGQLEGAGGVELLAGDLFAVTRADVGPIDAIYDRAALIALPPELRRRYVAHLRALAPGAQVLLVTLEYPEDRFSGPPFSVREDEVRAHYPRVELLDERTPTRGRIAEAGIGARERCYAATL